MQKFIFSLVVSTLFPTIIHAGGFNNPDTGPRKDGMLSVVGRPDDTSAIMHNVAGLASQRGNRIMISGMSAFLHTSLELKCEPWMLGFDYQGECANGREYTPPFGPSRSFGVSPFIGGSYDLNDYVENLVVGAAVYAPNFIGSFMEKDYLGRFYGIENYFLTLFATGAIAWKPIPQLSIGLGLSYMYVMLQSYRHIYVYIDEVAMKLNGHEHGGQAQFSLLFEPWPWLSIGAAFDTRSNLRIEGDIKIANSYDDPNDPIAELKHVSRIVVPWKLMLGLNIHPNDWFEVGTDLYYWRYSAFKMQTSDLIYPENMDPNLRTLLDNISLDQPRYLNDSIGINMGFRFLLPVDRFPIFTMFGVQYDFSPGNDDYLSVDSPFTDIYGFSMGVDSQPLSWLKVGIAWVHNWFVDINVTESKLDPPSNVRAETYCNEISVTFQFIL